MLTLMTPNFSKTARYAFAILAVILASILREALAPVLGKGVPFILFYPAVALAAWFGGFWPGLLSTVLGGFLAWYVFIPPELSIMLFGPTAVGQIIVFFLSSVFICLLAESLHQETRRAQTGELREREQREQLRVTLASIGDAVIATDARSRVTFMNHVAESLTGWTYEEASGKTLDEVFHIVNEQTRQPVQNPAVGALEQGVIVALANRSVLIAKDGREVPIDDSAAPIHDDIGRVVGVVLVFRDITERRRAEKAQSTLAAIVESSEDAIISKDVEGRIMTWNAGAERLFGYRQEEVIGKSITLIIPPDRMDEESAILERIRDGERIEHYETVRVRKDGSHVDISLTVSPVKAADGTIVGASKIARDVTDRRRMEQQLLDADRQKDNFIAMLAHELRNPLSPIRNAVKILEIERPDDHDLLAYCDLIDKEAMQINRLLDDLLDISRITTGKLSFQKQRIDIATAVNTAVETIRPIINEAGHKLTINCPAEPLIVEADPSRLAQVFSNLLNNAAKFTESGGNIGIDVERQDSRAVVRVKDSGIGISPELLPKVFDLFVQGDAIAAHGTGGLGLGLTLARDIVEFHGGSIEARSDGPGRGSEFVVSLPVSNVVASTDVGDGDPATMVASQARSRTRIVVVDDNKNQALSLQKLLQAMGHDVRIAYDGAGAMKLMANFVPDFALIDLGLPRINGYDLARWVREQPQLQDVTLIAQTGWGREEDRKQARAAGYDHHLVKPVDPHRLAAILLQSERKPET